MMTTSRAFLLSVCVALTTLPSPDAEAHKALRLSDYPAASLIPASTGDVDQSLITKANSYFNGITGLSGRFSQRGHHGHIVHGDFYILRPGRSLFVYDEPSSLELVSDGTSLAIRDRRKGTQELVPLGQTPMKFFLEGDIDLASEMRVREAYRDFGAAIITFEDASTFGGESVITLVFDEEVETLQQWLIVDPQGYQTSVILQDLKRHSRMDENMFYIEYQRFHGGTNN